MSGRRLIVADLHGNYKGLKQALQRCNFSDSDILYGIGDYCDGISETKELVEYLMSLNNFKGCRGNHDFFTIETYETKVCQPLHYQQGGKATMESYNHNIPKSHYQFLKDMPFYIELDNGRKLLVHGGIPCGHPRRNSLCFTREDIYLDEAKLKATEVDNHDLMWDRTCFMGAKLYPEKNINSYDEIFIGHTDVSILTNELDGLNDVEKYTPLNFNNVWMLDTGAGYKGKVTIMDIDTKEYWQSDLVKELYPDYNGR